MGSRNLVALVVAFLIVALTVLAVVSCGSRSRADEDERPGYTSG